MVKRKLTLKESELVKLINQSVKHIQEQNMVPTDLEGGGGGVTYKDAFGKIITNPHYIRNKQKEIDDALGATLGKYNREIADTICNKFKTGEKLTDSELSQFKMKGYVHELVMDCLEEGEGLDSWMDYHMVLDIISVVLYVIGGIGTAFAWTGAGAVIAAVSFYLAIVVEFGNGLSYILVDDEPDYFMAGLTWCFMLMPVMQLAKAPVKVVTKSLSTAFKTGGLTSLTKTFYNLTTAQKVLLQDLVSNFPKLKQAAKAGITKVDKTIKSFDNFIATMKGYWGTGWAIKQLQWIKKYILKPIKFGCTMLTQMAVILTAYDPSMVGGAFKFLGDKFDSDRFTSFGDYLNQLATNNISGYSVMKSLVREFGDAKGVITTTKIACNSEEYQWLQVKEAYKKQKTASGIFGKLSQMGYSDSEWESMIWEDWQKGWRPNYSQYWDSDKTNHLNRGQIKDELALRILDNYKPILNYEKKVIEMEGQEEWANIVKYLECSTFIKEYSQDNDDFTLTLMIIEDLLEDLQSE
tara:strand:+ start:1429 stop:2994 length:1566 start_codon:yes stop_codon:yes gene_type:complete